MSSFIPKLGDHTTPLRDLLKENVDFAWNPSHSKAFQKVKSMICTAMTLAYNDRNEPVVLHVDASIKGLGAALLQNNRPIAFASKALTPAGSRYANIERELLAVVYGCEKFHSYLYGRSFVVKTDHRPLEQIHKKNLMQAPPRLQRMLFRLQPYDCDIKYLPGKEMVTADALSRISPLDEFEVPDMKVKVHHLISITPAKMQEVKDETAKDQTLQLLSRQVAQGW
ncbi:MAG: Ty3/Gypsy family RNase HI domain-containing protein, partial [Cohaesibacter sp.]|nr:Ty3/Gypsy family RNase HI domain-containing protein [Cohaesibacter sp.]